MSGKYMKVRRIVIPTITMILIASQLFGCSAADQEQAYNMMQDSEAIELEIAEPLYATDEEIELLPWLQLASLETHPELRTAFEELLGVTANEDGTKYGIVYTDENGDLDQNNTLFNALGNTVFTIEYLRDAEQIEKIEEIANSEYTDIEENQGVAAVVNAYFELLPDAEAGQFDGSATISRAQAMTLVMRATTPVNDSQTPDTDEEFTTAVGDSTYTDFAAPMNDYCYINTSSGLTEKTFNGTMSRGEYIYLLTKCIYGDSYAERMADAGKEDETLSDDLSLTTVTDGGDITFQESLSSPEKGLPTEMYQTLARAVALGFITEDDLNWDEGLTKSEAINLFIDAVDIAYANSQYITSQAGTPEATNSEGLTANEAVKADADYMDALMEEFDYEGDLFTKLYAYAESKGADDINGAWLIYEYGSAAGDQRSYAINQRTGEKIVAGPNSFFYGTSLDDNGAQPFYGSDKTYPGDTFPEFEENLTLAIEGKPAHTNGQ